MSETMAGKCGAAMFVGSESLTCEREAGHEGSHMRTDHGATTSWDDGVLWADGVPVTHAGEPRIRPGDELYAVLRTLARRQREYEAARKDHRDALNAVEDLSQDEAATKVAALSRIIARGITKTDAPKYLHEDDKYATMTVEIADAKHAAAVRDDALSIARQRLNTARALVLGWSTLAGMEDVDISATPDGEL